MLQHHLLLSFAKRWGRKQLLPGVSFVQVFTGDGRLVYHLTSRCLQCGNKTKGIPLKEPVRFIFQVDVDDVMPAGQKDTILITLKPQVKGINELCISEAMVSSTIKCVSTWSLWHSALVWLFQQKGRISCCKVWCCLRGLDLAQDFLKETHISDMTKCD